MPNASRARKRLCVGLIPHGEGKHAAQAAEARLAPARKGRQQHLGVALRPERVAAGGEFGAQFAVVVNAAVEDQVIAAARARHRLVAARWIDDGKATHARASPDRG